MGEKKLAVHVEPGLRADATRCIESLEWAEEIYLEPGVEVGPRHPHLSAQVVGAIPQPRSGWLLRVSSDEWVSEELRREIEERALGRSQEMDSFLVPSRCLFMGKWIPGSFFHQIPEVRLVRAGGHCQNMGNIHAAIEQSLPTSLAETVSAMNSFSARRALSLSRFAGRSVRPRLSSSVFGILAQSLFQRRLRLEGYPGVVLSLLLSFSELLVWAHLWELEHQERRVPLERNS